MIIRRKCRSETSDNMDRWKSRGGKSQRGEEKKREDQRGEREGRKKMQVREKVGESRFTVFFQWFVAPEGRKVGSLKRRVRSQLARWEIKKLHAVVARSTYGSKKGKNTPRSDHFWTFRCRKSARGCAAKHIFKLKADGLGRSRTTFGSWDVEKVPGLWREAHLEVKSVKNWWFWAFFDVQMSKKRTFSKSQVSNTEGF